jgi:hypothetical protein
LKQYIVFFIFACILVFSFGNAAADELYSGSGVSLGLSGLSIVRNADSDQLRLIADISASRSPGADSYIGTLIDRSLKYFFTGLSVPDEKFWVNLAPGGQSKAIDPLLANTDLGKIMLAADLMLKKDASEITNPRNSSAGRQYWDRLYAKAAELNINEMPIANRVWITPGNVALSEDQEGVRILRSDLAVCLESDYLPQAFKGLNAKQRKLQEYSIALMRELVLPALNKKVNQSPAYENLRQAYKALILSRWYRQRSCAGDQALMQRMLQTMPSDISGSVPYSCSQIYDEYMASYQKGDYNFSENTQDRLAAYMELITLRYFSGGIDMRVIATASEGAKPDDIMTREKKKQISFDIVIDRRQANPIRYAMERLKKDQPSKFEENLPPLSAMELDRQLIQKQDPAINRVMLRNL